MGHNHVASSLSLSLKLGTCQQGGHHHPGLLTMLSRVQRSGHSMLKHRRRADAAQHRYAEQASSSAGVATPSSYPSAKHAEPTAPPARAAAREQAEASAPPMPEHVAQACS